MLWSQQVLTTGRLRAVILNSGGANACTGPLGFQDTHATAEAVAAALSDWGTETGAIEVAVCSTGLIGDRLPMDKVLAGVTEIVHEMAGGLTGGEEAARAIMTTDTVPKQVALHHQRQLDRRRDGQGCGHAGPVAGHHAERDHHRRRRRRRRAGPGAAASRPRSPSTGSTSTAAARPTTPCCCWPPAPARSRPARAISTTRCCGCATTCARSCRPTPRASPSGSSSPSPARPARTTR